MIQNLITRVIDRLRPNNAASIDRASDMLRSGQTIKIANPKSDRYTFNRWLSNEDKTYNNFSPTTEEEKKTLSPRGYFTKAAINENKQRLEEEGRKADRMYQASIPSTAIKSFTYDPKTESLYVKFQGSKKTYFYPRVPVDLIEKWMKAPSKGSFFFENIHDQYTLNPGHRPEENKNKDRKVTDQYYRKLEKYYKNVRRTGRM